MESETLEELIFVYNADSGLKNALLDGAHKVISPATYDCSLCQLTHGAFRERKVWKDFRQKSDLSMQFLHKDDFQKAYASKFGYKFTFPLVLGSTQSGLQVVVSTKELNQLEDAAALIALLEART